MTGLLLYALAVSVMLGAAAALAEPVLRALRLPIRWGWAAAMAGSVALGAWALLAPPPTPSTGPDITVAQGPATSTAPSATPAATSPWSPVVPITALATRLPRAVEGSLARAADLLPTPPATAAPWLVAGWGASTALLLALLAGGLLRHARRRRGWPIVRIAGQTARLSPGRTPADGPAVAGLARPEIILPRWALDLPEPELRLVLRHEAEHRSARDPQLLAAAALLVSLCPWNPALWWQLRRLRDAVELDCDTRVLRAEGTRRPYAELLLRVGARKPALHHASAGVASPFPFAFPAIRGSTSQLERRLRAMRPFRVRPLPLAAGASAAILLAVSACMSDRPTPVEVETHSAVEPTASLVEERLPAAVQEIRLGREGEGAELHGESVLLRGDAVEYRVEELPRAPEAPHLEFEVSEERMEAELIRLDPEPGAEDSPSVRIRMNTPTPPTAEPLYVVDGVIVAAGSDILRDLEPTDIESIEVLKGAAAAERYGSRASNGVIHILTTASAEWRARNPPPTRPGGP